MPPSSKQRASSSPSTASAAIMPAACVLLAAAMAFSLFMCPHSKVEESFGLQAVHDLFYYGIQPAVQGWLVQLSPESGSAAIVAAAAVPLPYDHVQFPGVVPRTFAGPALLAGISQGVRGLLYTISAGNYDLADHPVTVQALARAILLLAMLHAWWMLAVAVDRRVTRLSKSRTSMVGTYLLLTTACQFHLVFYASRMLPNTFAVLLTLRGFAAWISDDIPTAAAYLVVTTVIVRCDVLLLLFTVGLSWLLTRQFTVFSAVKIGVVTGVVSLLFTVPLDTLLWQRVVWPEGVVFYFNAVLGKSDEWGVEPVSWYWTKALPKVLMGTAVGLPLAVTRIMEKLTAWEGQYRKVPGSCATGRWLDTTWWPFFVPAVAFVALYSCLGHKETRFLFPALPLWNLMAAVGLSKVHAAAFTVWNVNIGSRKKNDDAQTEQVPKRPVFGRLAYVGCMGLLLLTLLASSIFVAASRWNYPGGDALSRLIQHVQDSEALIAGNEKLVRVHVDVASAMTGVSLFGQREASARVPGVEWVFDKAGYEAENLVPGGDDGSEASDWTVRYTHLLTEDKNVADSDLFRLVAVMQGNPRLDLRRAQIATTEAIYILERNDFLQEPRTG